MISLYKGIPARKEENLIPKLKKHFLILNLKNITVANINIIII